MGYEYIGITVLWVFLYGYLIVASVDFGAGFFAYYARRTNKDHIMNKLISRYLSPVWEVTNVFFVFFFVGLVGFFPDMAYYFGQALLIPGSIAIVLLAIRGSFYAFESYGSKNNSVFMFLYGATGLLIPASLSTALTISEGGFLNVTEDGVRLQITELLLSPYSWSVVLLAIVSVLYISSMFLSYYAHRAGDKDALSLLRRYALFWSIPTIIASMTVFIAMSQHNPEHFDRLFDYWWVFGLSVLFYLVAVFLVYSEKLYGFAFIAVMLQFLFAFFGYGVSKLPYLLYPHVTISESVTPDAMGLALVVAFIGGLLLLIPSLVMLMRMFLFDADYIKGNK
ncbi:MULTISPECIES: cytochrome d ubiquinol oxidase subunit II [Salimicrobium]|uniref:Cytochrome bd-I ubiquinol oxidase subunit 2 apoprotein n=2 Tax=Salimicrobium TaxID=351195 RepID=A0ABY1KLM1_9BACI|nr:MULTISPECIES: cytochrome d ubiquinol oxidase subunit II [Salimicrobium]SDX35533.1 cytochrome d ubiquinol oxidase subunit II [Salimicrobium album]SIS47757.1 cytochrome bd-I ubiquinol oxidase subunit 2 apoprotein [Salimicrobium salexigens]